MMSTGERGASSSSCTSVNTVCSDNERPVSLSLSSSTSLVSLQDASHSSSSSSCSSSLPYGAVPAYNASLPSSSSSTPKRNSSDISLDLTPLVTPHSGAPPIEGGGVAKVTAAGHTHNGHIANPVAAMSTGATPRKLSRLERVILEIVETEQTYVRDLKSIVEDYLGCIIDCGTLPLKPEQVSTLFCNIEDIYEFNSDLLEDLERSPDAAAIAECFVERSEAFDIYTLYCMNYPNSVAVLRDCMKNRSLVRFFLERQTTLNHSLPLETYLLKPVQRILKYHLLLQELSKHIDKSDPGYEVVEDAIITMTAVAWYINDMKRKQEHAVRLQEIESLLLNWSGPDLSGFGELVLEGSFKVLRVKKERAFFLFDKMLLIAKKRLEQFIYSTHIFCCNLQLVETLKDPLCFKVSDQTIPKQQHIVQTKNQEEKRLWVHYLKRLIVENHPASLPQKARQVLGDNFCQTPQFDQENPKKSCASPRLDDLHSFRRGRRQSEPPELYTPEKSRKTLPLLLEGTLPYRRTRRQSAPAKDIEAALHPGALKQAGSEGELCPPDGLGSAGSSSTLASSVIEVETERAEPRMDLQLGSNQQGEEEEELTTLRAPPTLSITEEILEFINQSRVREGLATMDPIQDLPSVADTPGNPTCFTCPLPPIASSPDQSLLFEHDQEGKEVKNPMNVQDPPSESERATEDVQEIPDVTGEMEEMAEGNVEETDKRGKASDDEAEHTLEITPSSDLQLSVSVEEKTDICTELQELDTESTVSPQSPDLPHQPIQRFQLPKKGSNLTKKDKKIIEKIRSYYEAAAEADDDEAEDEGEARGGVILRRRSSFSHIPTGLVKESVSRFSVNGHQGEVVSTNSKHGDGETDEDSRSCSSSGPATRPADGEADEPLSSSEVYPENPAESTISDEMKDQLSSTKDIPESDPKTFPEVETEILDKSWNIYKGIQEENLEEPEDGKTVDAMSIEEETLCLSECPENKEEERNCAVDDTNEPGPTRSQTEPYVHGPEQEQHQKPKQTETQSTWSITKTREQANTKENLESFPSQSKVGRWSRHSRIVTANRALFEGRGSDVTGIDLFEVNPVVDPVLIENSERILSKVQTLARMYSAKASTMKVPLHHKRASTIRTQAWVSARMSGHSTQNRDKSPSQKEKETGSAAHTRSETKTNHQACKQTSQNQAQTMIQEKQRIQEGSPESHTDDSQAKGPCKPQPLGHVTPTCDQQTDGFTLSRPKDFICALTKPSSTPGETPSSPNLAYSNDTAVSSTSSGPSHRPRTQPEDQGSKRTCSIPSVSTAALDGGCSEFRDLPAEKHEDVPVYSESKVEQGKDGRLEQDEGRCVYSARGDWTSENFSIQPAYSEACITQTKASSKRSDADGHERDVAVARYKHDDMGQNEDQEVLETDQSLCSGSGSSTGLVHTPSQSRIAWVSHPGLDEEPSQRETWAEEVTGSVGSTRGQKIVEPSRANEDSSADICASREHFILPSDSISVNLMNDTTIKETFKYLQKDEASSSSSVLRFTPTSEDSLPTFTNQRPTDLLAGVKRASSVPWTISSTPETGHRKPDEPVSGLPLRISSPVLSVFSPSLIHRSPSPLRSATTSSVQAPPCSSPFRVIPVSCSTAVSPTEFTSALSCLSSTPSTVSSGRTPTPSVLLSEDSSLSRGPSSSPTPPSNLHSSTCSSPSSSAFTRSLAASHISQSISQSMAKNNMARQQAPTITLVNQSSSSTSSMRQRTPSPNPPPALQGTGTPAYAQLGCIKNGYQHPRCPSSSLRSSCLSPSSLSQCPPSPSAGLRQPHCSSSSSTSPCSSFLHSKTDLPHLGNKNTNNNNTAGLSIGSAYVGGAVSNRGCSGAEGSTETHQSHYPLWSGSHNRVAQPFSASEPSSRVHSPTPSPTPALFVRLGSPPQHNYSSMANKPPHPRSSRVGGSHNYLALHLDLTRASSEGSTFDDSSACVSPQILSPPPIGVPVWTNNVAAPQPRNPRYSTSPSLFSSTLGSQTHRMSSSTSGRTSISGSSPLPSQTVHWPLSASLADRPLSPPRTNGTGLRRSWVDLGQRSLGFLGNVRGSFEQLESCPISPSSGWSSHSSSPSCLSPRACLQSPLSPNRFTPGKGAISGQHFTSVPWPDVQELSTKYNGTDSPETSVTPTAPLSPVHRISSLGPTDSQSEWVGPELEEGTCRNQLICAYVARPSHQQNVSSSSCLILSPTGLTSSSPELHQQYNLHAQSEPQVTTSPPASAVPSSSPLGSSPLSKQGNQKASYATTVNLQIAGSGRITSFSTAQVSLTQTLQAGAGPPGSQEQLARRVSINGLSPVPQRCNRL
ncbi:mucin-5AC isoform X3 [Girardinichthys multiradiatus]|nr:mucin-5AC isoform X3 [Girardinichthys multiradiatus]